MRASKAWSIFIITIAYVLAIAVAVLTWQAFPGLDDLWRLAVADLAATVFIFCCSVVFNNSSMYDPYWSVKPAVIASSYAVLFGFHSTASVFLFILMMLYNLRLTSNFLRDWPGLTHEDWRYRDFRAKFPKLYWSISFFGIHLFPTVMVYLACIPLYFGMKLTFGLNWLGWAGILVTLLAIVIAFVADEQMRFFRRNEDNRGRNMDQGLWRYSRHPNYFGEILTWWGIYLVALNADPGLWWTGIGALAITLMFQFVSIPMMDARSLQRRPGFKAYMARTRSLLPFPKK